MQEQDFQQIATAEQVKKRELSADDLQHEIGGQETGRMKRHLPRQPNAVDQQKEKEKEQRTQALLTLAMLIATDPEYAKLHRETMDMISRAETVTEIAIAETQERLRLVQEQLSQTLRNATRIPDGQGGSVAVFKDANGQVWTEHDEQVTDQAIIDGIVWKDGSPTREKFQYDRETVTHEQDALAELQHYQMEVLGNAREKMTDDTAPPQSKPEIQDIQNYVKTNMPEAANAVIERQNITAAPEPQAIQNTNIPTFSGS